jgi:hypothetical protein
MSDIFAISFFDLAFFHHDGTGFIPSSSVFDPRRVFGLALLYIVSFVIL